MVEVYPKTEPRYDVSEWFGEKPFSSPRIEQKQIIPLILEELAKGTKNIIVESPTGSESRQSPFLSLKYREKMLMC